MQEVRAALGGADERTWDAPAAVGATGTTFKVRALLTAAGRPNAVFLPLGAAGGSNGAVTAVQAGRVATALLATRLDREALQPDYALRPSGLNTNLARACVEIVQALQMPAPPPPPPPPPTALPAATTNRPPAAATDVTPAEPPPEPPATEHKPKPDEVW